MACPALATEEAFIQNLGRAARFNIKSDKLTFYNSAGDSLMELSLIRN